MTTALQLPAAAGPVVGLASRNGRYVGCSLGGGSAGVIRLWSGTHIPATGEKGPVGLLDEIGIAANGTAVSAFGNGPLDGEQYVNGIYVELVSGTMPTGVVRVTGPHS